MTTTETRNHAALARAIECWNADDLEGYLQVYAEDVRVHGLGPVPLDKSGVRAFYEQLRGAIPRSRIELHETFGADEQLVSRFTLTGRHDGPLMGVPATGSQVALPGMTILHFADGRCVERWVVSDMLGLLVQIGAVPAPA